MRTQEGVRAEARTMELRAVAQLGRAAARSPTPPCRRPAAAPAAPAAPCAPPYGRSNSAVAPQSRRRASDIALWRRACASPTLSMRALPARTPCGRHRNPSSEPAGGSLLPPPPPSSAGAAAPSSLVLPICTEKNSVSKSPPQGDFFFGLRRAIFLYGEDLTGSTCHFSAKLTIWCHVTAIIQLYSTQNLGTELSVSIGDLLRDPDSQARQSARESSTAARLLPRFAKFPAPTNRAHERARTREWRWLAFRSAK